MTKYGYGNAPTVIERNTARMTARVQWKMTRGHRREQDRHSQASESDTHENDQGKIYSTNTRIAKEEIMAGKIGGRPRAAIALGSYKTSLGTC